MKDRLDYTWQGEDGSMDASGNLGSAAKGSSIGLEAAGSGPVSCRFFIPLILLAMCSSLACTSYYYYSTRLLSPMQEVAANYNI